MVLPVIKYLIASLLSFVSMGLQAEGAQKLGSPAAVLDALQYRQGDVVLALIDGPADQSDRFKSLQGLLSVYSLELNGVDLGQVRRNDVLQVRPRLGLNKLIIRDAFKDTDQTELNFPAMRSAGVSTTIVEIQTSRQFNWIQALPLSKRDVRTIHDALERSQHGGMGRVIELIRSRGKETAPSLSRGRNWGNSGSSDDESDSESYGGSDENEPDSGPSKSSSVSSRSQDEASDSGLASNTGPETASDNDADLSESTEKKSSAKISADRRSYY